MEALDPAKLREDLQDGSDHDQVVWAVRRHGFEQVSDYIQAAAVVLGIVRAFLDHQNYFAAARILWGVSLFDPRPTAVQLIFDFLGEVSQGIIIGASSLGKSYSTSAWMLLDWIRDPEYTCVKCLSTTAGHLHSNVFSTLHRLHAEAVIPLPGTRLQGFIGLDSKDRYSAIERVSVRDGEDGAAALKGFHPIPRRKRHPVFGWFSRVRGFLDEAEDIPQGVWSSVGNLLSSKHGPESVKIIGAANPRTVTSIMASLAEPTKGWGQLDLDEDYIWRSKDGWDVLRLDGAVTENVVQGKVVYVNFLTAEGYDNFALKDGGESDDYFTFARAAYPLKGHQSGVMPPILFDGAQGDYIFRTFSVGAAGIDLAFEGADKAKMAVGRYGEVTGFRFHRTGQTIDFKRVFWAAQVDQIIDLKKLLTLDQAKQIHGLLSTLMVQPEWVLLDKGGNATGVYDDLRQLWSPKVKGINFGENASHIKITEQDGDFPWEIYENAGTEMYFAVARWLEHGYLRFGPHVDLSIVQQQFTRRRVKSVGKGPTEKQRKRLEKKPDYKKRYRNESPDDADSVCLFLHSIRLNGKEKASALGLRRPEVTANSPPTTRSNGLNLRDSEHDY